MNAVHPADTALLVTRAPRKASTALAVLVTGWAARNGAALAVGLVAVLALHLAVGVWARRRLADRLDREWAAVEPRWSHPRAM